MEEGNPPGPGSRKFLGSSATRRKELSVPAQWTGGDIVYTSNPTAVSFMYRSITGWEGRWFLEWLKKSLAYAAICASREKDKGREKDAELVVP